MCVLFFFKVWHFHLWSDVIHAVCARINENEYETNERTRRDPSIILSVSERDKRCMWWHCFYEQFLAMINVTQSFQLSVISSYYRRLCHEIGARLFSFYFWFTLTLHLFLNLFLFFSSSVRYLLDETRLVFSSCCCRLVCLARFSSMLSIVILHFIRMEIDSVWDHFNFI